MIFNESLVRVINTNDTLVRVINTNDKPIFFGKFKSKQNLSKPIGKRDLSKGKVIMSYLTNNIIP